MFLSFGGLFGIDKSTAPPPSTDEIRVSQIVFELCVSEDAAPAAVAASPCSGGGTIATAADPANGASLATSTRPVLWAVFNLDSGSKGYAYEALPDPSGYHHGFKAGRIVSVGTVTRAASDDFGGFTTSRLDLTLLDGDGFWRNQASLETIRYRSVELFIADDATRIAQSTARRVGLFFIQSYRPNADMTFTVTLVDPVGSELSAYYATKKAPGYPWPIGVFTQMARDYGSKVVPLYYGSITDESLGDSASGAPTWKTTAGIGSYNDSGIYHVIGLGTLPTPAIASPTGVALAVGGAASGSVSASVPDGKYAVIAQAQDAAGLWTDPTVFYLNTDAGGGRGTFASPGVATATVPDSTRKLTASCAAVTGAVRYRFELFVYYYGARPIQYLESATPSVDFTTSPAFPDVSPITTGAAQGSFFRWRVYRVRAVLADGATAWSSEGTFNSLTGGSVSDRPAFPEWNAVASALYYQLEFRDGAIASEFIGRITTTATFVKDTFNAAATGAVAIDREDQGAVPAHDTGDEVINGVTYARWGIGLGTYRIQSLFVSDLAPTNPSRIKADPSLYTTGVILSPHETATWPFGTKYREFDDAWFTMFYTRADHPITIAMRDGTVPPAANICGMNEISDGSGNTISSGPRQVIHCINNFLLPKVPWKKGSWFAIQTSSSGVPLISTDTMEEVITKWATLVTGGLVCAWGIGVDGTPRSFGDFLRMAAINLGIKWFETEHGALGMRMYDVAATAVATFTDTRDIIGTPTFIPASEDFINVINGRFKKRLVNPITNITPTAGALLPPKNVDAFDWLSGTVTRKSDLSIARHLIPKPEDVDYEMHRDGAAVTVLQDRMLELLAFPRNRYTWATGLKGFDVKHLQNVFYTDRRGATSGGDVNRRIAIESIGLNCSIGDQNGYEVTLEGIDVTGLSL